MITFTRRIKILKKAADELGIIYGGRAFKKYDKFNIGLVGRGDDKNTPHAKAIDKFYKELKRQGYSGVMDRNDKKFSGYRTKNPTIFFDQKHLKVAGKKRLTDEMIKKENGKAVPILTAQTLAKPAAALAAVTAINSIRKIHGNVKKIRSIMKSITGGISYGYFSIRRFWWS